MKDSSIQLWARIAGVLFLISVVAGGFGEGIAPAQLIVSGDAAATAHNVASSNFQLRAGFAAFSIESLCDAALTAILYLLLRPVNRGVALVFVPLRIMATATFAFAELFYFLPVFILGGEAYLKTFTADQLNTLTLLSLNVYSFAGLFSGLYYGVASLLLGYLVVRSGFLPRWLGVLWFIGGAGFVAGTYVLILVPAYATPVFQLPTILAVLLFGLWLTIRGVDEPRWRAMAQTAA
jgi:Domain of unknown function (DUF4386)